MPTHKELIAACTCRKVPVQLRLVRWHKRAKPIIQRRLRHGHKVNGVEMERTMELLVGINANKAEAFRLDNWHKSHHCPDCPCSPRHTLRKEVTFG